MTAGEHQEHKLINFFENIRRNKGIIQKDLKELEKRIYPRYQEIASSISSRKSDLRKNSEKLKTALFERGKDWHKEIDKIIRKLESDADEMEAQQLDVLYEQEDEVTHTISEITQNIADLTKLVDSDDIDSVSAYTCTSRNEEFRKMSFILQVYLPVFSPPTINTEKLFREFGSISALSITAEEPIYPMSSTGSGSSSSVRPLLDVPQIIATIDIGCTSLYDFTCSSDEKIWTMGRRLSARNFFIKLYNLQGELLFSFEINPLSYIALTKSEDLVFINIANGGSLNLCNIKNKQIKEVIRFQAW